MHFKGGAINTYIFTLAGKHYSVALINLFANVQ